MTIAGGTYRHDVFYSYAWGEKQLGTGALRDWTRNYINHVNTLLKLRFNNNSQQLSIFLDSECLENGARLDAALEKAVRGSALFVAVISKFYRDSYASRELRWFLDQMAADGSNLDQRLLILLIDRVDEDQWPAELRDRSGDRILFQRLHDDDEDGAPLDFSQFIMGGPTPQLGAPGKETALEIQKKLVAIKKDNEARTAYESAQRPPASSIVFFEAESQDEPNWKTHRQHLSGAEHIILPAATPQPATAMTEATYGDCDGMVLLRSREDDQIAERLRKAYLGRRAVLSKGKLVPWVLLDELDNPPPEADAYRIPSVVPRGDWVPELQRKLLG